MYNRAILFRGGITKSEGVRDDVKWMEKPYTFHYFREMYCNELYEEYLTLKENEC